MFSSGRRCAKKKKNIVEEWNGIPKSYFLQVLLKNYPNDSKFLLVQKAANF